MSYSGYAEAVAQQIERDLWVAQVSEFVGEMLKLQYDF
jgi:hypothetical protein